MASNTKISSESCNDREITALMYAKTAEQTKLLIDAGADVNAKDRDGRTALMKSNTADQKKLIEDAISKANEKTVPSVPSVPSVPKHIVWLPKGTEFEVKFFDPT